MPVAIHCEPVIEPHSPNASLETRWIAASLDVAPFGEGQGLGVVRGLVDFTAVLVGGTTLETPCLPENSIDRTMKEQGRYNPPSNNKETQRIATHC